MEIVNKNIIFSGVRIKELKNGDCFLYKNVLYMKIYPYVGCLKLSVLQTFLAGPDKASALTVDLESNRLSFMLEDLNVIPVNAQLIVSGYRTMETEMNEEEEEYDESGD